MTWAVQFEEVSKRYRGAGPRYASLRHDLSNALGALTARLRGAAPDHQGGYLALDRVSFEVKEGESFAIVGPNGAGKSTALKILSQITYPTGGRVRVRGRIGALIEVGSGVHPELTGRENIWLYGQILGMSKADVRRHFDEIVEFAELGHVLDTPLKMYSSGMQLRLGFAIASHLEPDIFVIDEALAVGDAGFQVKCIERMAKLVREGRTLFLVSHTLPLVREVCSRGILLDGGRVVTTGTAPEVVSAYLKALDEWKLTRAHVTDALEVTGVRASCATTGAAGLATFDPVLLEFQVNARRPLPDAVIEVGIADGRPGNLINLSMLSEGTSVSLDEGPQVILCRLESVPLLPGAYEIWFSAQSKERAVNYTPARIVGTLVVTEGPENRRRDLLFAKTGAFGPVCVPHQFELSSERAPAIRK